MYYPIVNDLIGGWAVATENLTVGELHDKYPPGERFGMIICDMCSSFDDAEKIALALNWWKEEQ